MLRFAMDMIRTLVAIVREVPKGKSIRIERKVMISCNRCDASTRAVKRFDVSSKGVAIRDTAAPDRWGIRYVRREGLPPLPTYYCSSCSSCSGLMSLGKAS